MTPRLRKFTLTLHVMTSVGWLGAVVAFLALAVAALLSLDAQLVRANFLALEMTGWYVIVPIAIASLLTGLIQSLGTKWGLFRHYWVLIKLVITLVSMVILIGFIPTFGLLGELATDTSLSLEELHSLGRSPVLHGGGGLLALIVVTTLSVYKPQGLTNYGRHKRREQREASQQH